MTQARVRAGAPLDAAEDRANKKSVADVVRRIEDFQNQFLGGTFGLVGPWGSGKSSLAIAAASQLQTEHGWQTATFEPWAYADYASTLEGFFTVLRKQLGTKKLNRSARKKLSKFFASVAPFGAVGNSFGIPLREALEGIAKLSSEGEDFISMRGQANRIFSKAEKPILIVIEDLDRLDAQELMNCFKLIRLLGELDNVYYLLCYDEQTLVEVMQKTDVIGPGGASRAYEYLEKIVQVRVEVLELYGSEQASLWKRDLESLINLHNIHVDELDSNLLDMMWQKTFRNYLTTPRALARFTLHLKSAWHSIAGEVNFADFVGLNFLRFFENAIFRKIKDSRALLINESNRNTDRTPEPPNAREKLLEVWLKEVEELKPRNLQAVRFLLSALFFSIKNYSNVEGYSRFFRRRRLDSVLYFDRYFRNSLSDDDIPERAYGAFIQDTIQNDYCELSLQVKRELNLRNPLVWERTENEIPAQSDGVIPLYQAMREEYGRLMEVGGVIARGDDHILRFVHKTFANRGFDHHSVEWYEKQANTFGGLAIGTDIYLDAWETRQLGAGRVLSEFDEGMLGLAQVALEKLFSGPTDGVDHSALRLVKVLQATLEPEDMRVFLRKLIETSSEWTVFDFLVGLLTVQVNYSAEGTKFCVGINNISEDAIDHYLGLEWVKKQVPSTHSRHQEQISWSDARPEQAVLREIAIGAATNVTSRKKAFEEHR